MYEGLTKAILEKSIFDGIDIQVRSGKIKNSNNEFSDEIDCMVVLGEGELIPYTDKYIYDSSKVIAVIQVKKNLFSKDIRDSYENLKTVLDVTEFRDGEVYHARLLRNSWRMIFNEELPTREELQQLPYEKEIFYHVLLLEAFYPARIVWGYNGFKSEFSLRESFIDYIEENISSVSGAKKPGFGPLNFPNLIICDKYSLVKTNGIPFGHPVDNNNWWPFLVSSHDNPVYFLLEIIWTRLHFMYGISAEIFGDDLVIDEMHGFLLCRPIEVSRMKGWEYQYIPTGKKELEKPHVHKEWEPVFLDNIQFVIINQLSISGKIDLMEIDHLEFIKKNGYTIESFIKYLKQTGLIDVKGSVLSLITDYCQCGITQDGRYFAGDNKTGRVSRWMLAQMDKKRV